MTTDNQLKDFQMATVNYVFKQFTEKDCDRFLIADEVGLGKTMIARGIIQKLYQHFKETNKTQLNVIYICSNQSIASQNISRLNIERNSAGSITQINRINDLAIVQSENNNNSFLKITALSPNTSFNISKGGGVVRERAIIFNILCKHATYGSHKEKLKKIFQLDVQDTNWNLNINETKNSIQNDILEKFNSFFDNNSAEYNALKKACDEEYSSNEQFKYRRIIGGLRKILASVCVEYLKPDLIIMDEFQRFKQLIDQDEENDLKLITENLFTNDKIKILLLSATPYKMYSIQADDDNGENHYEEFKFVVYFILKHENKKKEFNSLWNEYVKSLLHLDERNWDFIKEKKEKVELILKSVIARTERVTVSDNRNTMIKSSEAKFLWIKQNDILNFISTDAITAKLGNVNSPIEYCKSTPYPFSFMEGYQLQKITQKQIQNGNIEIKYILRNNKNLFLPVEKINNYEELDLPNAKLNYLLEKMVYNSGCDLLWIPPSIAYYEFSGVFTSKENFSKILVFSSWVMVPKMIAALSSYECERLTIGITNTKKEIKYYNTKTHKKGRLRFNENFGSLSSYALLYPSIKLCELWNPLEKYQSLTGILNEVKLKIKGLLSEVHISGFITVHNKKNDDRWCLLFMLLLDRKHKKDFLNSYYLNEDKFNWNWFEKDEENSIANDYYYKVFNDILFAESLPLKIFQDLELGYPPEDIAEQLAYLTIASPAICSFRLINRYTKNEKNHFSFFGAFRIADSFRKFFNSTESTSVIDKYANNNKSYWQNVLIYSACGNFQSMLDEFANTLIDHNGIWNYFEIDKINKIINLIADNIGLRTVSVTGHTYDSFIKETKPKHFRCHFGVALNQSLDNEKDIMRSDSVRDAFNSPFRPFILSTTSIGQEGLDFHLYCRKILHWNLPSNPVDFEQREGRINRFKNLAIRQNLAKKYVSKLSTIKIINVWDQLYEIAAQEEKGNKSELVPYWHIEPENIFIERHIPIIPYSKEVDKLRNLLKTISIYRIALGQPRQEDLINHIIDNFKEEEIEKIQSELLINLSPFKIS